MEQEATLSVVLIQGDVATAFATGEQHASYRRCKDLSQPYRLVKELLLTNALLFRGWCRANEDLVSDAHFQSSMCNTI